MSETTESKKRKSRLSIPAATLKRVMQSDDDVGRIAQSTPAAMSRAIELFAAELVAAVLAEMESDATTMQPSHMYVYGIVLNDLCVCC
jgi:histone H3/H4